MTASDIGYERVLSWVKPFLAGIHSTAIVTVAWVILCIIVAQRLSPARLARAIPAEDSGSARSRLRRVHRWWQGPELEVGKLAPRLIAVALAMLPKNHVPVVALDTTRTGKWEIWQAGIVFAGHTLPVAWAAVPYPWPKGRFRSTTLALIAQLQAAFPSHTGWVLVADRGFPSAELFARLLERKTGWTVRLRLGDWVEVEGVYATVRAHLEAGRLPSGKKVSATIGRGTNKQPRVTASIVISDQLPEPPKHKRNAAGQRQRAKQAKRRAHHLGNKGRKSYPPSEAAQRYAQTWVLFTTASTAAEAIAQYAERMTIEQTFRDWHYRWGLREAVAEIPKEEMVGRMVGIVSLAYWLQVQLGWLLSGDTMGQQRRAQWTVSDRVSLFWCGQQIFLDPGYHWADWLAGQWRHLIAPDIAIVTEMAA